MKASSKSHFIAAILGGMAVAVLFLALGVTGRRNTETVVQEAPAAEDPPRAGSNLTAHAIYVRYAPSVAYVRAAIVDPVSDPFGAGSQRTSVSTGSGFLVNRRGYLLTADHVIAGAGSRDVTVQFQSGVARPVQVVAQDRDDDLALLKVDMTGLPAVQPLVLGDSTTVRVGDPTLGIGNPFGLDRTLTSGIISALQRQLETPDGFTIDNVIQTDAPLNPGSAGGPLLDATGKVIGINSEIEAGGDGAGPVEVGFAVPVNTAKQLLAAAHVSQAANRP